MKNSNYSNSISKLAGFFKQRDNHKWLGAITGQVIQAPPNLVVKLQSGITIKKNKILVAVEKLADYSRMFELVGTINSITINATTSNRPCGKGATNEHGTIKGSGNIEMQGVIKWTDTLKVGDTVLMLPTNNHDYFYLVDRVVML